LVQQALPGGLHADGDGGQGIGEQVDEQQVHRLEGHGQGQQGGVEQDIGNGSPGLVGDVSDEGGDLPPLLVQGPGGGGGAVQEAGQPGLQGGGNGLVEGLLQKAVVNGLGQHPVQPVRLPSGAPPVVQAEQDAPRGREEGEEQKRDRHGSTAHT